MTSKELLALAGQLANRARAVVGGDSPLYGRCSPANVFYLTLRCDELRKALDEYDRAIMACTREKDDEQTKRKAGRR